MLRRNSTGQRKEDQEIFFTKPEREIKPYHQILSELESYQVQGARLSLNGVEFEAQTLALLVAESSAYMRDYEFTCEGQVESLDFRSVRNK